MASDISDRRKDQAIDDQDFFGSRVVNLKDLKNHKQSEADPANDTLDSDLETMESERKAKESENNDLIEDYLKEYDDTDPADKLFEGNPSKIDTPKEIPDNPGIMQGPTVFPATLTSLAWSAPDKHHELISHAWRKAVIVLLVGMAFLALFWQDSLLTAVTFFGLAFVTSMHFWREIKHEQHEIYPHGVVVAGKFYHYHDFDSFWVHFHPQGFHELSLKTGRFLNHYLKVPLGQQDPFEVRDALMSFLPEEKHEQGLDDWLRRKLGL